MPHAGRSTGTSVNFKHRLVEVLNPLPLVVSKTTSNSECRYIRGKSSVTALVACDPSTGQLTFHIQLD